MNDATLQIVSNTSLSIFFGIVIGVVLAPIIAYADQSFRKNDAFTKTNYLLIASWVLVPVFTLYFAYTLFSGHYETAKALAPLGMMIAAMIASASVMKNIAETKVNEDTKHNRDIEKEDKKSAKEDSKFHLEKCTEGLKHIYELLKDGSNKNMIWEEASNLLLITLKISNSITEESHKVIFLIEKKKYRHLLLNTLNSLDINKYFFYGYDEWKNLVNIKDAFTLTKHFHINPSNVIPIMEFVYNLNTSKKSLSDYEKWEEINLSIFTNPIDQSNRTNIENMYWFMDFDDYCRLRIQNKDIYNKQLRF